MHYLYVYYNKSYPRVTKFIWYFAITWRVWFLSKSGPQKPYIKQTTDCVCENKCFCIKAFIEKSGYKTIVVQTTSHQILTPFSARWVLILKAIILYTCSANTLHRNYPSKNYIKRGFYLVSMLLRMELIEKYMSWRLGRVFRESPNIQINCSRKFRKIRRKTPIPQTLF